MRRACVYAERLKSCLPGKRVSSIIDWCVLARVCASLVCVCAVPSSVGGAGLGRLVPDRSTSRDAAALQNVYVCVHWAQRDQR